MALKKLFFGAEPIGQQVIGSLIAIAIAIAIAIDWLMNLGAGWTFLLMLLAAAGIVLRIAVGLLAAIVSIFKPE